MTTRYSLPGAITFDAYLREASLRGAEDGLLARLPEQVPVAHGWVVQSSVGSAEGLWSVVQHAQGEGEAVRLRVLGDKAASANLKRTDGPTQLAQWKSGLASMGQAILVAPIESELCGRATSTNAASSDADEVCVWAAGATHCWHIERRSTRVSEKGEGLDVLTAEAVADLVDRVQLALGLPVEVEWVMQDGRPVLLSCRNLDLPLTMAGPERGGSWRRVSLALDDEGTVVPLAIDVLDRALRRPEDPRKKKVVERIFARPYRRRTERSAVGRAEAKSLGRAGADAARVTAEVTAFLNEVARFDRRFPARLEEAGQEHHQELDADALGEHLTLWQELAAEPLRLLDRARRQNRALLSALESVVGPVTRDLAVALSMPQFSKRRREVHAQLSRLAEFTQGRAPSDLDAGARVSWKAARAALADVRSLGIDLTPVAFGSSNLSLSQAVAERFDERADRREARRREASDEIVRLARTHLLGLPRAALAQTLIALVRALARTKGALAESLATTLLGLRAVALETGRRLEEDAVLDDPEDALYLTAKEIRKSLRGNVAGYAARVRARREDDERWGNFAAPRRLGG